MFMTDLKSKIIFSLMWIKMCQFILLIQLVYNQTTLRVDGGWIIVLNATFNNISNAP